MFQESEIKKKKSRKSMVAPPPGESTPKVPEKVESPQDFQDDDAEKQTVSRSGRKIKPKRFHDFENTEGGAGGDGIKNGMIGWFGISFHFFQTKFKSLAFCTSIL